MSRTTPVPAASFSMPLPAPAAPRVHAKAPIGGQDSPADADIGGLAIENGLGDTVDEGECSTSRGPCWRRQRPIREIWPGVERWLERLGGAADTIPTRSASEAQRSSMPPGVIGHAGTIVTQRDTKSSEKEPPALAWLRAALPDRVVVLDLETCGFAGSCVFLTGLIHSTPDRGLVLTQLLARHYGEESAMLEACWQLTELAAPESARGPLLVTFNGKTFDWPCLRDRSVLHRLPEGESTAPRHCDLLHLCRRRFRGRVPNCRLQTLESWVCGRRRTGDIPGAQIPDLYHECVRNRDWRPLHSVLHHNALDLVTSLQLACALLSPAPAAGPA